jgi:hypothetical protein
MVNVDERIIQVEQRIEHLEIELGQARQQLQFAELRARRATRRGRIVLGCAAAALVTLSAGTAAAGAGPGPLTVKAPFKVVDSSGAPLLTVTNKGLVVFADRAPAVRLSGDTHGGRVDWFNPKGTGVGALSIGNDGVGSVTVGVPGAFQASLGSKDDKLGLRIFNGTALVAGIGESSLGGAVQLNTPSGTTLAYLGESAAGGQVTLHTPDGKRRALLGVGDSGNGDAALYSGAGTPMIQLAEHANGGYFYLGNTGGVSRVEAGVTGTDQGVVRAFGPAGFNYIQGRSGS